MKISDVMKKRILLFLSVFIMLFLPVGCKNLYNLTTESTTQPFVIIDETSTTEVQDTTESSSDEQIDEDGVYTSKDDVALYIHTYNKLPDNYITKKEAKALGWTGGGLDDYAYGCCLGGDKFGNKEKLLPVKEGRIYYECDIDTLEGSGGRGAKRIVFTSGGNSYGENADGDDWNIYYTEDHYKTFEHLYGEDDYE